MSKELEQDNAQLRERYAQMQTQVAELSHERSALSAQMAMSANQLSEHVGASAQFRDLKVRACQGCCQGCWQWRQDILKKRTEEVKMSSSQSS